MRNALILLMMSVLALAATGFVASAAQTGTPAWSIAPLTVYEGPGNAYNVVGDVEGEVHLTVLNCTSHWCNIRSGGTRGWVSRDHLSFGQEPRGPFTGPRLDYKAGGPGEICLYEGRNYSGEAICAATGTVVHDLLLFGRDNRISSIAVTGEVSVTVCRDRDFASYCERINDSTPSLHGFLDNNVSSYRVY